MQIWDVLLGTSQDYVAVMCALIILMIRRPARNYSMCISLWFTPALKSCKGGLWTIIAGKGVVCQDAAAGGAHTEAPADHRRPAAAL